MTAFSVDGEADASRTADELGLPFPVGFGVDAFAVSERFGSYVNEDPPYLQPTSFVVDPGDRIRLAVYSSERVGRLVASDAAELIESLR